MVTAALTALVLPGLALLVLGIRGRRVGTEPRCRKCAYDLTGLDHLTCPECGMDHSDVQPRVGTRKRGKGAIVGGVVLLAISAAGGVSWGRNVDWYVHLPARALIWLADGGDARAVGELESRFVAGNISAGAIERLVTMCLAKQAQATVAVPWQEWIDLLEQLDVGELLTAEQQASYYRQVVGPHQLRVRDPIGAGSAVIVEFTYLSRAPRTGLSTSQSTEQLMVGDVPLYRRRSRSRFGQGVVNVTTHVVAETSLNPGRHALTCSVEIRARRGVDYTVFNSGHELTQLTIVAESSLEVLEPGKEDVTLVPDEEMGRALRDALYVVGSDYGWSESAPTADSAERVHWFAGISVGATTPIPVSVAFDVFARDGTFDYPLGTFSCVAGSRDCEFDGDFQAEILQDLEVGERPIVFWPSVDVARNTVDLHEIWDGELILGPVRVGRYEPSDDDMPAAAAPLDP